MGEKTVMLVFAVLSLCVVVRALPGGAPEQACGDLVPQHGASPQGSNPPYRISVEKDGRDFLVSVESSNGRPFRGFILQARDENERVVGHFHVIDYDESQIL